MTSNPASVGPAPDGLLPCPFCGDGPSHYTGPTYHERASDLFRGRNDHWVQCSKCGAMGPCRRADHAEVQSDALARDRWNTRAPHPDREAEPTGGVAEGDRLTEAMERVEARASSLERIGATADAADLRTILQALSASPPVVEGSSLRDTQPGAGSAVVAGLTMLIARDLDRAIANLGYPVGMGIGLGEELSERAAGRILERLTDKALTDLLAARHQPATPGEQGEEGA